MLLAWDIGREYSKDTDPPLDGPSSIEGMLGTYVL